MHAPASRPVSLTLRVRAQAYAGGRRPGRRQTDAVGRGELLHLRFKLLHVLARLPRLSQQACTLVAHCHSSTGKAIRPPIPLQLGAHPRACSRSRLHAESISLSLAPACRARVRITLQ